MQKKTKYCNSLVSKVLPTINEIGDNNLIFNQIDNSLCFTMWILQAKRGLAVYDVWPRLVWIMDRGCRTQSLSV